MGEKVTVISGPPGTGKTKVGSKPNGRPSFTPSEQPTQLQYIQFLEISSTYDQLTHPVIMVYVQ